MAKAVKTKAEEIKEEKVVDETSEEEFTETTDAEETKEDIPEEPVKETKRSKAKRWLNEKARPVAETTLKIIGAIALVAGAGFGVYMVAKHNEEEEYETEEPAEANDNVIPFPEQEGTEAA